MTRPGYTHLVLLVDRSGSMKPIAEDMTGGIAQMLADQAAAPGAATVSLYQFDDRFERVSGPDPAGDVPAYTLRPRGTTALLDAFGRSITETVELVEALVEDHRPEKVIFAVVTDGAENASREWTRAAVMQAVAERQAAGWEFAFLSADLAAVGEARDLGISARSSATFGRTRAGTRGAFAGLSRSIARSRAGAPLDLDEN
jgi:hypothetical protein